MTQPFVPTMATIAYTDGPCQMQSIVAMAQHSKFSFEELRYAAYHLDAERWRSGPDAFDGLGFSGALELYDLERDPAERENLAEREPEIVKELLRTLEARAARVGARPLAPAPPPPPDPEQRRLLRSLGYLDD